MEDLISSKFGLKITDAYFDNFYVADSCSAISVNGDVHRFVLPEVTTDSSYSTQDTVPDPAWTNPAFNADFSYAVDAAGLYKYAEASTTYSKVGTSTFYSKYQIWTTSEAIVVFTWKTVATTTNTFDYSVQAFSIPTSGSTYTAVGKI